MSSLERLYELEAEDEFDRESSIHRTVQFQIRLNLGSQGFKATDQFLDEWMKRSAAGQIGTTLNFRGRFCGANHYTVDVTTTSGSRKRFRVAELWGLPFVYLLDKQQKPVLGRIMPRGWHLSQVGRSVPIPRFCRATP